MLDEEISARSYPMTILRPSDLEWLFCLRRGGEVIRVLDAICHWQQNLFFVRPGVAQFIRPVLSYWGKMRLEAEIALPAEGYLDLGLLGGPDRAYFLNVYCRLSEGGQVIFVDKETATKLGTTPGDFLWPPPDLPGPAGSTRVSQACSTPASDEAWGAKEESLTVREFVTAMGWNLTREETKAVRFTPEGGIRSGVCSGQRRIAYSHRPCIPAPHIGHSPVRARFCARMLQSGFAVVADRPDFKDAFHA
jgi:hypothetical protein